MNLWLVLGVLLQWVCISDTAPIAQDYLTRYGYLDAPNRKTGAIRSRQDLSRAIRQFQRYTGLQETGIMDAATKSKMEQPRCGLPDIVGTSENARRKRRYALQGSRWEKSEITYRFASYGNDLSRTAVRRIFARAAKLWSDKMQLNIKETSDAKADFTVSFNSYDHGDGDPFDGPGGTLAHAFFPQYGGDLHFDDSETYTEGKDAGVNLLFVAAHELGHTLGLSHSDVWQSVMAPYYPGYKANLELHEDDVKGIRHLYGSRTSSTIPTSSSGGPDKPAGGGPDTCTTDLDTVVVAGDGNTYAFKDAYVWKLRETGFAPGYPQLISKLWPGLPDSLDAAVGWGEDITFFFKGKLYWKYQGFKVYPDYPKRISNWGLPGKIDAAFVWGRNGRTYFIKDDKYYRHNPYSGVIDNGYPRPLSVWPGLPERVDAAVQDARGITFFFYKNYYFRFDDDRFRVDYGYPKSMNKVWLGCETAGQELNKNKTVMGCPCTCGAKGMADSQIHQFILALSLLFVQLL
ncbi:predicted protein [Nematostella vectensis]|uniref:Peptidase metallopeptidase domain-containing protein n=1 Tax=Nematostella vectensis TaxID=45351 RepID=A7S526_NEMVE|nr:predicted protein [Nematostella vectensis]|eukprot:XP_001633230.1 predicted protein [Nematostella vectensis]